MKVHSPAQLSISPRFSTGHPTNRWTRYSAPCFLVLLHPPPSVASPDRSRSKPERLTMIKHRWNGSFPRKKVTRLDILFVLPIFLIQSFPTHSTKQCIGIWSSLTSNRLALMPKPWVVFPITVNTLLANLGCSILGTPPLQIYFEAIHDWSNRTGRTDIQSEHFQLARLLPLCIIAIVLKLTIISLLLWNISNCTNKIRPTLQLWYWYEPIIQLTYSGIHQ